MEKRDSTGQCFRGFLASQSDRVFCIIRNQQQAGTQWTNKHRSTICPTTNLPSSCEIIRAAFFRLTVMTSALKTSAARAFGIDASRCVIVAAVSAFFSAAAAIASYIVLYL